MFQATRRRLALWYTVVTAVLLLTFASGFYLYVRGTLIERVDDTLSHVMEVVQRSLVIEPDLHTADHINLAASFGDPPDAVEDDRIDLEWYDTEGTLLWSTLSDPLEVPLKVSRAAITVEIAPDYWLRQMTRELTADGHPIGYLRVSHPWFEVTKPSRQLIIDLSIGTSVMIGLVAAIGWLLSRLAIEPIQASYQQLKQFTADASHELRNPIALIQTTVQVALTEPDPDLLAQRQQLEVIERLTQRLGRLVDDLLFLARQDSRVGQLQFQPCPLDALLMEVVDEQRAIARSQNLELQLHLSPTTASIPGADPFTLPGDYDQLARLFTNLISNAIQHSPPGNAIRITLQPAQHQGTPHLQIEINDQGTGIPDTALPHLFNRFYRVDPARTKLNLAPPLSPTSSSGTGLGLAIVKAICENHQGQIQVASQIGKGTTFTLLLPQSPVKNSGQNATLPLAY